MKNIIYYGSQILKSMKTWCIWLFIIGCNLHIECIIINIQYMENRKVKLYSLVICMYQMMPLI